MPMEIMLKSKIVRETIKAKGYDLNQVETGRAVIGEDLRILFEKLADDKLVVREKTKEEPEVKKNWKGMMGMVARTPWNKRCLMEKNSCSHWLRESLKT